MSEWSIFGIAPTSDKRTIKRAYAKLIKTIDPSEEPERFQQVREAYDYLLEYGRFYVEEDGQETEFEKNENHSQASTLELSQSELIESSYPETSFHTNALNSSDIIEDKQDDTNHDAFNQNTNELRIDLQHSSSLEAQNIVQSSVELQQQYKATDIYQKTSYQTASEFVEKLESLFQNEQDVTQSEWNELIEDEEYQYFDVVELLRVEVFGYLVEQIEKNWEQGNQPEKLKVKLLKERLPKDFGWLVQYFAEHFDWHNTELILSNHFNNEQMKQLGQFYLNHTPELVVESAKNKSNLKQYLFWIIFLIVLVNIFSAMDKRTNKRPNVEEFERLPGLTESSKPTVFCSHYPLITTNERAQQCAKLLLPKDSKKRLILALYWFNQFDLGRKENKPQQQLDKSLDRGFVLLQQASDNKYVPAINLLAWMKLGKRYQRHDQVVAKALLEKSRDLGDNTAGIALAVGYYAGFWGAPEPEKANQILNEIDSTKNSANLNYVLAASYWLGVIKPGVHHDRTSVKQQVSMLMLDSSDSADLKLVNNAAWYFATANDDSYDPVLALNLARQFQSEYRHSQNWQHIDTLAAAYAARNNFDMAIESLAKAKELVESEYPQINDPNRIEALKILDERRLLFQQNKRIRIEPDNQAMQAILRACFSELMQIDLLNLPDEGNSNEKS